MEGAVREGGREREKRETEGRGGAERIERAERRKGERESIERGERGERGGGRTNVIKFSINYTKEKRCVSGI